MTENKKVTEKLAKIGQVIRNNITDITNDNLGELDNFLASMRYSALAPSKMIRSYLLYQFCKILDIDQSIFIRIATAIEMVHCYSLIHDDLPAMDNDDYRRGQEACHKKYNEGTAILCGDALQALAFETLAHPNTASDPYAIVKLIAEFSAAIGYNGMVGGQYLDLYGSNNDINEIIHMQKLKTGKLIEFSCMAPLYILNPDTKIVSAVKNFAHDIGIAYQIKDDLLDITGKKEVLGKTPNKDKVQNKKTLISFFNQEKAQERLNILLSQAKSHLNIFGDEADELIQFVDYLQERQY
jgi:farnesyl diphosphate synthase